jgi:hypothetical protein
MNPIACTGQLRIGCGRGADLSKILLIFARCSEPNHAQPGRQVQARSIRRFFEDAALFSRHSDLNKVLFQVANRLASLPAICLSVFPSHF